VVFGFGRVPGSAGFVRSVSAAPPPSPDISVGPSSGTIAAPLPGSARCNIAGALAQDRSAARIPSTDNAASAAGGAIASAGHPLDFRVGV